MYNPQTDDEFDDYKLKLFEKENSILKHLIELEEAKESERKNKASESGRKISSSKQDEPVFKTPKGYLDSFLKPDPDWVAASANKKTKSTTTKKTSSSTTKKPKYFFHGIFFSKCLTYIVVYILCIFSVRCFSIYFYLNFKCCFLIVRFFI